MPIMGSQEQPSMQATASRRTDRWMHNASVDEFAASQGECAQVHLPTGRICTLPHGHPGSCQFISPDAAYISLAHPSARKPQ